MRLPFSSVHGRCLTLLLALAAGVALAGCSSVAQRPRSAKAAAAAEGRLPPRFAPTPELEERILALDPAHVTAGDVSNVLVHAPAPRLINIHGGVLPIPYTMNSFADFLVGMGFPRASVRNPVDGTQTFGYYEDSKALAGMIAWYYERDGLRPMVVGHSLGGIRAVEILHHLAGDAGALPVFNPLTWRSEDRREYTDPLTGERRPVVGTQASFVTAVTSGGLGKLLPGEWDMWEKLRVIPDTVVEFTGFYLAFDALGGDNLGFGAANHYHAQGTATVRNVRLPDDSHHLACLDTRHLLKSRELMDWITAYQPGNGLASEVKFEANSRNIIFAAEVWWSIKRHWVLELQRFVRERRARAPEPVPSA